MKHHILEIGMMVAIFCILLIRSLVQPGFSLEVQPVHLFQETASYETSERLAETVAGQKGEETDTKNSMPNLSEVESVYDPVLDLYYDLNAFNALDAERLCNFDGIGMVTAQAIVDYRTENGKFESFEALINVKGIGEKKLAGILKKPDDAKE